MKIDRTQPPMNQSGPGLKLPRGWGWRGAHGRLIRAVGIVAAIAMTVLAGLNLLIDPYGAYGVGPALGVVGLEIHKNTGGTRAAKAELARRGDWKAAILGSSRVEVGFDAQHEGFGGPACNLGLSGTSLPELDGVLRLVMENNRLSRLVIGLDFEAFSPHKMNSGDFEKSPFSPAYSSADYHLGNLLGMQATEESWRTLREWRSKKPGRHDGVGRITAPLKNERTGHRELFARSADIRRNNDLRFQYSRAHLKLLQEMMERAAGAGVKVDLVINPTHAIWQERCHRVGRGRWLEEWKRDLLGMAMLVNARTDGGASHVRVWDFAGFWEPNIEPIPAAGDLTTQMQWHWDADHFKKELGDRVLGRVLGTEISDEPFGLLLTTQNIEAHLKKLATEREAYARTHPLDLELID